MKKLFLSLLAVGFLAIAPATSLASNSNIVATNCPNGGKKVDAKAFTNKLVKELKLNKKQAAELLKLNNEYADILVCPKQNTDCKKAESCCKKNEARNILILIRLMKREIQSLLMKLQIVIVVDLKKL